MTTIIAETTTLPAEIDHGKLFSKYVKSDMLGMVISPQVNFEQWSEIAKTVEQIGESNHWHLADVLNAGEELFGEPHAQVISATGKDPATIAQICAVAKRFAPERRRGRPLKFSHHKAVAYIEPNEKADELLDLALKNGWTVRELEDEVAKLKGKPTRAQKKADKERQQELQTPANAQNGTQNAPGAPVSDEEARNLVEKTHGEMKKAEAKEIGSKLNEPMTKAQERKHAGHGLATAARWLTQNAGEIPENWKAEMEVVHKAYRRKWQNGKAKK